MTVSKWDNLMPHEFIEIIDEHYLKAKKDQKYVLGICMRKIVSDWVERFIFPMIYNDYIFMMETKDLPARKQCVLKLHSFYDTEHLVNGRFKEWVVTMRDHGYDFINLNNDIEYITEFNPSDFILKVSGIELEHGHVITNRRVVCRYFVYPDNSGYNFDILHVADGERYDYWDENIVQDIKDNNSSWELLDFNKEKYTVKVPLNRLSCADYVSDMTEEMKSELDDSIVYRACGGIHALKVTDYTKDDGTVKEHFRNATAEDIVSAFYADNYFYQRVHNILIVSGFYGNKIL